MKNIRRIGFIVVAVAMGYGCTDVVAPRAGEVKATESAEERPARIHASRGDRIFSGADADSIIDRMARALAATGRPELLSHRQEATRKYGAATPNQQEDVISHSADGGEAPIPATKILSVSSVILLTSIPFPDGGSMPPALSGDMYFVGDEGEIAPNVKLTGPNEYEHPVSSTIASGGGSKTCSGAFCNNRKLSGVVQLNGVPTCGVSASGSVMYTAWIQPGQIGISWKALSFEPPMGRFDQVNVSDGVSGSNGSCAPPPPPPPPAQPGGGDNPGPTNPPPDQGGGIGTWTCWETYSPTYTEWWDGTVTVEWVYSGTRCDYATSVSTPAGEVSATISSSFATLPSSAKDVTVRLVSSTRLPRGAAAAVYRQPNVHEPDVIMVDIGRATVADLDLAIAKLGDLWPSTRPQSAVSFIPKYPDAAKKKNTRKHDDSEKLLLMLAAAKRSPVPQLGNVPSITFTLKSDRSAP